MGSGRAAANLSYYYACYYLFLHLDDHCHYHLDFLTNSLNSGKSYSDFEFKAFLYYKSVISAINVTYETTLITF